jgi:hypothetical protein
MRAPLCGENLVRVAFLDEAGRSRGEPIIVVAGPIVHGDRTYRKLVTRLGEIAVEFIPEKDRKGFIFHAKDIFHGGGKYFKLRKEEWPRERRYALLMAICDVPRQFCLPITFGSLSKSMTAKIRKLGSDSDVAFGHFVDGVEHAVAFGWAEIGIDKQMHAFPRDEICMLIAEDTDRVKAIVKEAHALLRDPDEIAAHPVFSRMPGLPIRKVEDTPHFAAKAESAPLQIADACAFLIMRRLMRRPESQQFFEAISQQLVWSPSMDGRPVFGERMGSEQIGGGQLY